MEDLSDLDLAFRLQMEEAIAASLSLHPASQRRSLSPPPRKDLLGQNIAASSTGKHDATVLEREVLDRESARREARGMREDAAGVSARGMRENAAGVSARGMSTREYGEPSGGSGSVSFKCDVFYRLYFKGLVSQERVGGSDDFIWGIGTAICDERNDLLWEKKTQLFKRSRSRQEAEITSLLLSLQDAVALGINRLVIFCDYYPVYQFLTRRWIPRQRHHASLMAQVFRLTEEFRLGLDILQKRNHVKFAFKLAREATRFCIFQHPSPSSEKTGNASCKETCVICFEDANPEQMFSVDKCSHRYCFSCMRQYVEVKLRHGFVPSCPHEGCQSELLVDNCAGFLTPKSIDMWKQRIKEALIPVTEKVYCPYPRCSALMSKTEVSEYARSVIGDTDSGVKKCVKCHGLFCFNCKVPWHSNMSCSDYKQLNPNPPGEDGKLTSLAKLNLWRRCVKCQHMIELSEGCFHMTCRCGYEFCYKCGAEWKNKEATCSCPLWDEHFILHADEEDVDDDFDAEDLDYDYDYTYDYDYDHAYNYDHTYNYNYD